MLDDSDPLRSRADAAAEAFADSSTGPAAARALVWAAAWFEGCLLGGTLLCGFLFQTNPFAQLTWNWPDVLWGTLATVPLLGLFWLTYHFPFGPLRGIREFLHKAIGPALVASHPAQLFFVALLAGVCEEVLFRGLLQPWWGIGWSNVAFGLAHAITPLYAVLAGLIGCMLGGLLSVSGNLLVPIVTHTLYDFVAFIILARELRRERS